MPNAIPAPSEPGDAGLPPDSDDGAAAASGVSPAARPPRLKPKPNKGHGRLGASDYRQKLGAAMALLRGFTVIRVHGRDAGR